MISIHSPNIKPKSSKSAFGRSTLLMAALAFSLTRTSGSQEAQPHEYSTITAERVTAALADGAGKKDISLAEGSLTALGWFVLYGNDDDSQALAEKLNKVVFDAYNGTDRIHGLREQKQYGEMLNLNRFEKRKPVSPSPEYTQLTKDRVDKALAKGAGTEDFKLAEGSLFALGWLTLYGNDAASLKKGEALMNAASQTWPGSNEVYMLITSTAYAEIINLGRFNTTAAPESPTSIGPLTIAPPKTDWKSVQDKAESLIKSGSRNGYQNAFQVSDEIIGVYSNPGMDEVFAAAIQNDWLVELSGSPGKIWSVVPTEAGQGVWLKIGGGHGLSEKDVDEGKWQVEAQKFSGKWIRGEFHFFTK